jgi:hypothetical protein
MGGIEGLRWYQRVFNFFRRALGPSEEKAGRVAKASLQPPRARSSSPSLVRRVQAQRDETNPFILSLIEDKQLKSSLEEISPDKRTDFDSAMIAVLELLEQPIPSNPQERMQLALDLDIKKDLLTTTLEKSGRRRELGVYQATLVAAIDERVREIRAPLRLEKLVSVLAREIPPSEGKRREEVTHLFNELHQNILEILPEGDAKRALDTAYADYDQARKHFDHCKQQMNVQPGLKATRELYLEAAMQQRASLKTYEENARLALLGATGSGVWSEKELASRLSAVEAEMHELRKGDLPDKGTRERLSHIVNSLSTQAQRRFFFAEDRTILDKLSSTQNQSDSGAAKAYHALQGRIDKAQELLQSWEKLSEIEMERRKIDPLIHAAYQCSEEGLKGGKQTLPGAYFIREQLVAKLHGALTAEGRLRAQTALNKLNSVIGAYELIEDRDKSLFSSHRVIKSADAFIDAMQNKKGGLPIPFEDFEQQDEALSSLMRNKEDRYSAQGFEQLDEDVKSVLRKETGRYSEYFLRMVEKKQRELRAAWRAYNTPNSPLSPDMTAANSFSSSSRSTPPSSPHMQRLQASVKQTYSNLGPLQARFPDLSDDEKVQYKALKKQKDRVLGEIVLTGIAARAIRVKELESDLKWMQPQLASREGVGREELAQGIHQRETELAQLNRELSRLYLQELDYRENGVTSIQVTDSFDPRFTETLYKSVAFKVERQQRLEARDRERIQRKEVLQKALAAAQGNLEAIQIAEKSCREGIDAVRQVIEETTQDIQEKRRTQSGLERDVRSRVQSGRPIEDLEAERGAWTQVISLKEAALKKLQQQLGEETKLLREIESERKIRAQRLEHAQNDLVAYLEKKKEPPPR